MTIQQSHESGILLIDILLAFALMTIFVSILTASLIESRNLYSYARATDNLLQNGSTTEQTTFYGNDLVETTQRLSLPDASNYESRMGLASTTFLSLSARPVADYATFAGTPLCAPHHPFEDVLGTYSYFSHAEALTPASSSNFNIHVDPITLPIDPSLPLTDLQVRNGIAYISTDSSKASDPDILVADITDIHNPTIRASINSGPGIDALTIAGNYIYGAAPSTASELHVFRINSLDSVSLVKKYRLQLPYATATPALGSAIFYNNRHIFLGTNKWDGSEFNVIDVSDPTSPKELGSFETGSKVNALNVDGNVAYVADSDQDQLRVLDISNPSSPNLLTAFSPSGWSRQEGRSLSVFEHNVHFGRTSGGYDISTDHELFSFATTSSTTLVSFTSQNVPGGVYGMVTDKVYTFLVSDTADREFQVYSNLICTTTQAFSFPTRPQTLTCDGDTLYVLSRTAPVIYQIHLEASQ